MNNKKCSSKQKNEQKTNETKARGLKTLARAAIP